MFNPELQKIKKGINEEGWDQEEGAEGGAAVLIGKKEEMKNLQEKLESEGKAIDVASYIRMHKEIYVPKEEFDEIMLPQIEKAGKGWCCVLKYPTTESMTMDICFIDKDKNLAKVSFSPDKITDEKINKFATPPADKQFQFAINNELKKIGFKISQESEAEITWKNNSLITHKEYQEKLEKMSKEKISKEFDF